MEYELVGASRLRSTDEKLYHNGPITTFEDLNVTS
jgi:hypothetical protein